MSDSLVIDGGPMERVVFDLEHMRKLYDINGNYKFDGIKFRPGASRTVGFGVDVITPIFTLRTHNAVDSGRSQTTGLDIYAPIGLTKGQWFSEYGSFGTLLIAQTDYDFEFRFAHMSEKDVKILDKIKNSKYVFAGELVGICGNEGVGTGAHLHFEVVSEKGISEVLEKLLTEKFGESAHIPYSKEEVEGFFKMRNLTNQQGYEIYNNEVYRRGITFINSHKIIRKDYQTGRYRTFYSSLSCFDM